ncbi:hypothetical protein BGZ70_002629, partial [Mortierella alpina]
MVNRDSDGSTTAAGAGAKEQAGAGRTGYAETAKSHCLLYPWKTLMELSGVHGQGRILVGLGSQNAASRRQYQYILLCRSVSGGTQHQYTSTPGIGLCHDNHAISKNSKMMNLINFRLRITLSDSRVLTGQMLAFDKHMNLVLADCEEFRKVKAKAAGQPEREEKRTLGLVILRGETIVSLSVDGPPPPSAEDQKSRLSQMTAGSGMAAPAGRGMPVVPGAAPGLTGP